MSSPLKFSAILLPAFCLLVGASGAVLCWGRTSEERAQDVMKLAEFRSLSTEEQSNLQLNYSNFRQSDVRSSEIRKIFEETQKSPKLQQATDRFSTWRLSVSQSDWEAFQALTTDDERLEFVKARWNNTESIKSDITIEFSGPPTVRLPTLHLTFGDFWKIISTAHPPEDRPEALQKELAELSSDNHRALRLALSIFERFQTTRSAANTDEMDRQGERLRGALLKHVTDEAWKGKFSATAKDDMRFRRIWLALTLMSIMDKATVALGDDLRKEFPVTPQQIVDAFSSLQDKELQHSLMTMPAQEARMRLELIAQTTGEQTPEQRLLALYRIFAKQRQQILRMPFGLGGPFMDDRGRPSADGRRPPDGDRGRRDFDKKPR